MNFRKNRAELPQFQMTAMMDIVFLLLCFFITASVFSQWEYEVELTLPTAKESHATTRLPQEIILNVRKDGTITFNQQERSDEELNRILGHVATHLKGAPVTVRADKEASYGDFMRIVDLCKAKGIANLSLATADEKPTVKMEEAPAPDALP